MTKHYIYRIAWILFTCRLLSQRRFEFICRWLDGGWRYATHR